MEKPDLRRSGFVISEGQVALNTSFLVTGDQE